MKNWAEFTKDRKTVVILNLSGAKGSLSAGAAAQAGISNRKQNWIILFYNTASEMNLTLNCILPHFISK